jgi:predicted RND superfamily exporter protein
VTIAVITTVAGLIQMAIEIAAMTITISAITSVGVIYALASTREPTIVHPMKVIAIWNTTPPTAHRV